LPAGSPRSGVRP